MASQSDGASTRTAAAAHLHRASHARARGANAFFIVGREEQQPERQRTHPFPTRAPQQAVELAGLLLTRAAMLSALGRLEHAMACCGSKTVDGVPVPEAL